MAKFSEMYPPHLMPSPLPHSSPARDIVSDVQTPVRKGQPHLSTPPTGLSDAVSAVSSPGGSPSVGPRKQLFTSLFSSPGSRSSTSVHSGVDEPSTPSERGGVSSPASDVAEGASMADSSPSDAIQGLLVDVEGCSTQIQEVRAVAQGLRIGIEECDMQIQAVRRMSALHSFAGGAAAEDKWLAALDAIDEALVILFDNFHATPEVEEPLPQTKIRYMLMRAAIQLKLGLFHAAERSCCVVLRIDPFCSLAHYRRGVAVSMMAGDITEAEGHFRLASKFAATPGNHSGGRQRMVWHKACALADEQAEANAKVDAQYAEYLAAQQQR